MLDIESVTGPIVYVLKGWGGPDYYKIGCTGNLRRRYGSKRSRAQIVHVIHVDESFYLRSVEEAVHMMFMHCRVGQETFALTDDDLALLPRIVATKTGITLKNGD